MNNLDQFSIFQSIFLLSIFIIISNSCGNKTSQNKSKAPFFQHYIVDSTTVQNPWAKIPGDINNDGSLDIIIGGQKGPLVWYRNPDWEAFTISEGGYNTVDGERGDIDGDGDLDIVMGGLYWYENPGRLDENPDKSWTTHLVAEHPTHDIELADLNGDKKLDIISRNQSDFGTMKGNTIHLWFNLGDNTWEEEVLDCEHGEGLRVIDLDKDNDDDIVAGGFWFENRLGKWEKHAFSAWHASANLAVADINNNGRLDIILTPSELATNYFKISWFEQPMDLNDEAWKEHILVDSVECVIHGVGVGDFNVDGLTDIAYSEMHQGSDPDEVVVLINKNRTTAWEKMVISEKGSHSIEVADIDGDGIDDIFGANWSGTFQPIELWINKR